MVGASGFEPPTSWSRTGWSESNKAFVVSQLGSRHTSRPGLKWVTSWVTNTLWRPESSKLGGPVFAKQFCLFQDCLCCFLLFVGWVTVLAEDALDHCAELGANALLCGPVNRHVSTNGIHEFASNLFQRVVTENFNSAVVHFERVVERQFFVAEAQILTALIGFPHVPSEVHQFLNDLGGLNGAILVFDDGALKHFREDARLNQIPLGDGPHFVGKQFFQNLES